MECLRLKAVALCLSIPFEPLQPQPPFLLCATGSGDSFPTAAAGSRVGFSPRRAVRDTDSGRKTRPNTEPRAEESRPQIPVPAVKAAARYASSLHRFSHSFLRLFQIRLQ